jgi:small subunit ribosomal protein S17e
MGRVKNIAVKTLGNDILEKHRGKFTDDFDSNKKVIAEVRPIKSKKIRNIVAGYVTKKVKKAKSAA